MNISRSLAVCVFFFIASSAWAVDPSRRITQYAHTQWRIQDGTFNGTPNALTQTADGYLWIGTQTGLVRFDGVRFVPWKPPEGKQLSSPNITALLAARDGSLWIGTEGGLSHWRNNDLVNYPIEQGRINSIIEDHNGTIWIARSRTVDAAGPLCQVINTSVQCFGKADGIPEWRAIPTIVEDRLGNLWIAGDTGILRWKPDLFNAFAPAGLKTNKGIGGVAGIAALPDGSLWAGVSLPGPGLGLQHQVQGVWKPFVTPVFDSSTLEVQAMFLDRENSVWVGTLQQGVYRIHGDKVDHFRSTDGLSSNSVNNFYEDREGNVWIATSKGIDSFRDIRVATISIREGLGTEEVDSVLAARDGTVWIGGAGVLDALRNDGLSSLKAGKGLPGNQVTSLFEDHAGNLWVGLDNTLSIYNNGRFSRIDRPNGSQLGLVVGIAEDLDNNIWVETIGSPRTLFRLKDNKVQEEFTPPQIPSARRVAAEPEGGIWLGLMNGDLARYRQGRLEIFDFTYSRDSRVEQVTVNDDGSVLGATAVGLIGWRNGKQQILTARNGLPCDSVYAFVSDSSGDLWLYMQCGLVQIAKIELQRWWENPDVTLQVRVFDTLDGVQPGLAPFQSATRSTDGRLWFANGVVLQVIDPARLGGNSIPPPVHIEEIVADRKSYSQQGELRLPPLTRDLEIDYTALSFVAPQKVRFRYKLEGRDADWQDAETRRQAFFSDLRPGAYRFRVIACNNDGLWNDAGATLSFSIAPAWYQTNWFLILSLVSALFVIWALYRMRVRQVAKALSARFDERLAERTRIARELHDTFLQTIQGSKMVADDALEHSGDADRLRRSMEQLSVWLGQATQEGRAALNSLRSSTTERNDLAEAFRRATHDGLIPGSMTTTFSVVGDPRDMHPIVRDEVYRIGYEAIRNASLHSRASRLEFELRYAQDLTLRVSDNGIGIDPDVAAKGKYRHFGLRGMRERAARIGAKLTLVSSATTGTEITVVVPGSIVFREASATRFERIKAIFRRSGRISHPD